MIITTEIINALKMTIRRLGVGGGGEGGGGGGGGEGGGVN